MLFSKLKQSFITYFIFISVFILTLLTPAQAIFVSPAKLPMPIIEQIFPQATKISDKQGEVPVWTIYKDKEIIGYAFETNDLAKIPAYSGEPVNMLIAINPKGEYLAAKVLEHHEPIILAGIPETKLYKFADQYVGLSVKDKIKTGGNKP